MLYALEATGKLPRPPFFFLLAFFAGAETQCWTLLVQLRHDAMIFTPFCAANYSNMVDNKILVQVGREGRKNMGALKSSLGDCQGGNGRGSLHLVKTQNLHQLLLFSTNAHYQELDIVYCPYLLYVSVTAKAGMEGDHFIQ